MAERLTIGEFSRLTGLTAKALRNYDSMGLLVPDEVEARTGYRLYGRGQVGRARTIRRLRELDVPLEDIRAILDDPAQGQKRLEAHRLRLEAGVFRQQRILHRLLHVDEEGRQATMDAQVEGSTPGGLTPQEERQVAVDLFNHTWELLEMPDRSSSQDDRMLHAAHASRFHWEQVGDASNLAIGEWQCSRVYGVLGRAEPALHHAERCLAICDASDLGPFMRAEAFEALARAHAVAGDRAASAEAESDARRVAEAIEDPEERELFERDISTIPR